MYNHDLCQVVQSLLSCLDNPELPFLQWQECLSVLATRLPKELRNEVHDQTTSLASCFSNAASYKPSLLYNTYTLIKHTHTLIFKKY